MFISLAPGFRSASSRLGWSTPCATLAPRLCEAPIMTITTQRTAIALALAAWAGVALAAPQDRPSVLRTASYVVTIRTLCEEGVVACDEVEYTGVNRRTGKSIHLKGRDWIRYCPDDQGDGPGKTPCQHLGYEFRNGDVTYYVGDDGMLEVVKGERVLVEEHGRWDDDQ